MHRYRSKKQARETLGRYLGMHGRRIIRHRSRWLIVGVCDGEYHVLGDHGWAFDLPAAEAAAIIQAYKAGA